MRDWLRAKLIDWFFPELDGMNEDMIQMAIRVARIEHYLATGEQFDGHCVHGDAVIHWKVAGRSH